MVRSMMFFKNVKLMFWADAILCAVYVKNMCPSHALKNKTPYEMWYGHIPSVRHLRVFGSTCYALIPKEQRSKLDARSRKCIFLGYSNTTKGYRLYDETNKKFILSRDVIFLESSKKDETLRGSLIIWTDSLERHIMNLMIPHLEGGIPILGQSLESPFEAPSSPHEEVPTTSSELEVQLDDVIEKIEKLCLMRTQHHLNQLSNLDHLRKVHQNGSQKHLKVFILMRLERQNQNVLKTRWR
jgi:hypothetical protein